MGWLYSKRLKKPRSETKKTTFMSAIQMTSILEHRPAVGDLFFFQYSIMPRRLDLIITDNGYKPYIFSDTREVDGAVNVTTECFSLSTREVVETYFSWSREVRLTLTLFNGPNFSIWRAVFR